MCARVRWVAGHWSLAVLLVSQTDAKALANACLSELSGFVGYVNLPFGIR